MATEDIVHDENDSGRQREAEGFKDRGLVAVQEPELDYVTFRVGLVQRRGILFSQCSVLDS